MALHMLKMCVGVESVAELRRFQARRLARLRADGQPAELRHWTRNMPRRAAEIEGEGSLYWIIKGAIRARQRILALEAAADANALKRCAVVLDADIVETRPYPARPMQGWRYLEADRAPADLRLGRGDETWNMPAPLVAELRELGLL